MTITCSYINSLQSILKNLLSLKSQLPQNIETVTKQYCKCEHFTSNDAHNPPSLSFLLPPNSHHFCPTSHRTACSGLVTRQPGGGEKVKDGEEEGEERGTEGRRENGEVKWQEKSREDRSREPQRRERWVRSSYGETLRHLVSPMEGSMISMMVRKMKVFLMMVCSRNDL